MPVAGLHSDQLSSRASSAHVRPTAAVDGGRKVVIEYDAAPGSAPKPVAAVDSADASLVDKARKVYTEGNARLFAGKTDKAIGSYREALRVYPGYVAGYRGLGLAYAEQGKAPNAVAALKHYLDIVPSAKDAAMIRKRLKLLEKR